MKSLLRFLRAHPWWTGLGAIVLVVAGAHAVVEALARARLEKTLRAFLAAHPAPPARAAEGAAAAYLRALAALDTSVLGNEIGALVIGHGKQPPEVREILGKDAKALAMAEEALGLSWSGAPVPPGPDQPAIMDLALLFRLRARAEEEEGRRPDAVRTRLAVHRMVRQIGGEQVFPFYADPLYALGTVGSLLQAVEEPGLTEEQVGEILRDALRSEEVGAINSRGYERHALGSLAVRILPWVSSDRGTTPTVYRLVRPPTMKQRFSRLFGASYPPGVSDEPNARELEEFWETATTSCRAMARLAPEDFPFLATKPSEYVSLGDTWKDEARRAKGYLRMQYFTASWFAVLHAAAAARLHKLRTGSFPRTLEEMIPGTVPSLPVDPFSGKLPLWRIEGEEGVVESAGPPPGDGRLNDTWPPGRKPRAGARLR